MALDRPYCCETKMLRATARIPVEGSEHIPMSQRSQKPIGWYCPECKTMTSILII